MAGYELEDRIEVLIILALLTILPYMTPATASTGIERVTAVHIYYGYVPPSTDVAAWETIEEYDRPAYGEVDEIVRGTLVNYMVPSGYAVLDIVGLEDGTLVEIWDIFANRRINSSTLNRLEKRFFYIAYGTFFKIESSRRIAALLSGGATVFEPTDAASGTSSFYPSVTGGFRGREFIFNAAPPTHATAHWVDRLGYNFYLMALVETDWKLSDSAQIWSTSEHLRQRGTRTLMLQSRKHRLELHNGIGNDVVFRLTTSGDVEVSCCAIGDFVVAPAITGGYVGRLFYAPIAVTLEETGRTAAFIILPLEEGQTTIYDKELDLIATHSFTASDVEDLNYWYHDLGPGRFNLIAESTGDIAFIVGQTEGTADINHLGDDITFIGSRPDQEIRFYAPSMAIVFAPEPSAVTIDGDAPIQMAEDEFRLLESGVHSVSSDKHVIIQILAAGAGWYNWGSYLIEPLDVDVSFEPPEGFVNKPVDYTAYIAATAVAVVVSLALFVIWRRRLRRS